MAKYIDILKKSKEEVEQEDLEFKNEEALMQLDADIHETKKALSTARKTAKKALNGDNFDSSEIIDSRKKVEKLKLGLEELAALRKELFEDEE